MAFFGDSQWRSFGQAITIAELRKQIQEVKKIYNGRVAAIPREQRIAVTAIRKEYPRIIPKDKRAEYNSRVKAKIAEFTALRKAILVERDAKVRAIQDQITTLRQIPAPTSTPTPTPEPTPLPQPEPVVPPEVVPVPPPPTGYSPPGGEVPVTGTPPTPEAPPPSAEAEVTVQQAGFDFGKMWPFLAIGGVALYFLFGSKKGRR